MRILVLLVGLVVSFPVFSQTFGKVSFYGDSMTYRSDWDCAGYAPDPQACFALKSAGSYTSYVAHPQPQYVDPLFTVVIVNGRSGSTCHPRPAQGDPGLLARLVDNGEDRIAVMMGINDVNLGVRTIPQTIECLKAAWTLIADTFGAEPIAVTYPSVDPETIVWAFAGTSGAQAVANRQALNVAIATARVQFNSARQPGQILVGSSGMPSYQAHPSAGNTYDGVHPTPQGARAMANFFASSFF